MSLALDLETYTKTKGYVTDTDLKNMQFEIGERISEAGQIWDVYTDILLGKIYEKEGSYDAFTAWRDEVVLDRRDKSLAVVEDADEREALNEIVD
jgi:hypothetical protein